MNGSISTASTTVLIVDDHPAVREGLATRISRQSDMRICGEAADIPEALKLLDEQHPRVAVVDIALRGGSGIDLIHRIRGRNDAVRILVWSMYPESLYAARAIRAGANGYITKENATASIIDAIRTVRDGKVFLTDELAERMLHGSIAGTPEGGSLVAALSDRELEVFGLIGRGLKTGEIADRLHLSVHTVETHRQRIRTKLALRTGAELGRAAVQWVLETG
ncbi:MAG: response regulator transcription factor [Planctomycetaceae bacterium]